MNGKKLLGSKLWWNGPEFLYLPEDQWPNMHNIPASEITNAELITHSLLKASHFSQCRYEISDFLLTGG